MIVYFYWSIKDVDEESVPGGQSPRYAEPFIPPGIPLIRFSP